MATTWMKAIHRGGGIAAALGRSTDYISNPEKTNRGELIDSFGCEPLTAQSEFLLSKRLYEQKTGRDQGGHDVIAYHVRMSWGPGEVTAAQALELGRELALRWTKGKHQFIVAAHTNTNNPHAHIIFNSVNLSHDGKFQDFKRSAIALRRVSDRICLEHGLSIIEKPGLSKGHNRAEYLVESRAPTLRDRLRETIDAALRDCKSFDDFLASMRDAGCDIKHGKHLAFKAQGQKKFIRCDSLGEDYSEGAIRERIEGKRIVAPKQKTTMPMPASTKPNLLIDIQAKIQQGYGRGFEHFAKIQNLKTAAKTLIFLQEHGLTDYGQLMAQADTASKSYNQSSDRIKVVEARLGEIALLQKHIGAYSKTRDTYKQYRDSGWSKKFHAGHESDILLHRAAKKHFDSLGLTRLPSMQSLRQEYAALAAEKRKLYQSYRSEKENMVALLNAKYNVDRLLGTDSAHEKPQERSDSVR